MKKLKIFISTGEVSGDLQASLLLNKIKEFVEVEAHGFGGDHLKKTGFNILKDLTHRSSIGLIESLPFVFDRYISGKLFLKKLKEINPEIVIFVDNQGFNIPLSTKVKKMGFKTIYYFPPQISIWGKWNGKKLQKSIDLFLTPFYNDYLEYKKFNPDNVFFKGHPLFDNEYLKNKIKQIINDNDKSLINENIKTLSINYKYNHNNHNYNSISEIPHIYLMPGSRIQEIKALLPVFARAATYFYNNYKLISFLPISNKNFTKPILRFISDKPYIIPLTKNYYNLFKSSLFAIIASGTASLEALALNVPAIICYKISNLTFQIGKFFVKSKYVGMINILAQQEIARELLQKEMNLSNIIKEGEKIINNKEYRSKILNNYNSVKNSIQELSFENPIKEYAKTLLKYFNII